MKKKLAFILAAVLTLSVFMTGCTKDDSTQENDDSQQTQQNQENTTNTENQTTDPVVLPDVVLTPNDEKIVMKVGDTEISYATLRYYLLAFKFAQGGTDEQIWRNLALSEIMAIGALRGFAAENNITLPEEIRNSSLNAALAQVINSYEGTDITYLEDLEANFLTDSVFRTMQEDYLLRYYIYSEYFLENSPFYTVADEDITNYIHDNYVRVKHILVKTTDLDDAQKAEARSRANSILEQAQNGANFEELVKEYSEDGMDPETGYYFTKGQMVQEFETASFALQEGEISNIVESTYGHHIIKKYPMDDQYILTDETLRSDALQAIGFEKFEEVLNEQLSDIPITYYAEFEPAVQEILASAVLPDFAE